MLEKVKEFIDKLPKEVKVSAYILISFGIGELIKYLTPLEVDSVVLSGIVNIGLVFLAQLKARLDTLKKK